MKIGNTMAVALLLAGFTVLTAGGSPDYVKVRPEETTVISKLEAGVVEGAVKLPWRLFVPKAADKDQKLPLILFLHGAGRRGEDNIGPMSLAWSFITPEAQSRHPCFVLAPQINEGRRWVTHPFNEGSYSSDKVRITDEMSQALALVETTIATRPVDSRRIYVVGQSMGGYGTWDALIRRPNLWAAAVPICGGGDPSKAESIKSIPVWAWHGENDVMVPVSGSRDMVTALTKAGGRPRYTEVPKGGHGVWVKAFADPDLYEWLFAQRKPGPEALKKTVEKTESVRKDTP